ncbi:MAG: hypothetical protein ACE5OR_09670 [bacterium]
MAEHTRTKAFEIDKRTLYECLTDLKVFGRFFHFVKGVECEDDEIKWLSREPMAKFTSSPSLTAEIVSENYDSGKIGWKAHGPNFFAEGNFLIEETGPKEVNLTLQLRLTVSGPLRVTISPLLAANIKGQVGKFFSNLENFIRPVCPDPRGTGRREES